MILPILAALLPSQPSPVGHWTGVWVKAGDRLPVSVDFRKTDSGYAGSFDSDGLQVAGIPFAKVEFVGGKLLFTLRGDQTSIEFEGTLADNALEGKLAENGAQGTFQLKRGAAPAPLSEREVSFSNGAVKLSGSLIETGGSARRPAIVFVHGSGAEGRWATRFLAQKFARRGFVSLIFDKRGVGNSSGNWQQSSLEDLAGDALAGIDFLKTQVHVYPSRIGIYGHSQGGSVAPLVAERKGAVSFVIASAASGVDPAEAENYSIENSIGVSRLLATEQPDAKRFVREIVNVAYKGQSREGLDKMEQEFKERSWYFTPPPKDNYYWTFARRVSGFRPADHWRKVRVPVLLTYGEKDERVPPTASAKAIMGALQAGGNRRVTLKTFPNADHSYHMTGQTAVNGWSQRVATYADTLTTWAASQR